MKGHLGLLQPDSKISIRLLVDAIIGLCMSKRMDYPRNDFYSLDEEFSVRHHICACFALQSRKQQFIGKKFKV